MNKKKWLKKLRGRRGVHCAVVWTAYGIRAFGGTWRLEGDALIRESDGGIIKIPHYNYVSITFDDGVTLSNKYIRKMLKEANQ